MAKRVGAAKTGGRKIGTPNKRTVEIAARLEELGCDPIEGMARIAMNPKHTPDLRGRMYAELAQYLYPKRKALAIEPPDDSKGDFTLSDLLETMTAAARRHECND
jgi:hypothetical protein